MSIRVFWNVSSACAGRHHDRLVLVERRVEQDRHAGQPLELRDQPVVARARTSRSTVCTRPVSSTWVTAGICSRFSGARLVDEHHERRRVVLLEPLADALGEDRRRERPERLAVLDARVEDVLHVVRGAGRRRSSGCRARAGRTPSGPGTSRRRRPSAIRSATSGKSASSSSRVAVDARRGERACARPRRRSAGPCRRAPSRSRAAGRAPGARRRRRRRPRCRSRRPPAGRRAPRTASRAGSARSRPRSARRRPRGRGSAMPVRSRERRRRGGGRPPRARACSAAATSSWCCRRARSAGAPGRAELLHRACREDPADRRRAARPTSSRRPRVWCVK